METGNEILYNPTPQVVKAMTWAIMCHEDTNHKYGDYLPYRYHLNMVYMTAAKFLYLVPEDGRDLVMASCWAHDVIEDCRKTYNDVKEVAGEDVAEIVYALTNEKGKNRRGRGNQKYYDGIKNNPLAVFVKLCDRIANAQYSKSVNSPMFQMYEKEHIDFMSKIYTPMYDEMFEYLKAIHN